MPWAFWVAAIGLVIGAGMGVFGLVNPKGAARLVRLREDQPGGAAEFRATYGGLFLSAHLAALFFLVMVLREIEDWNGVPTYWTMMGAIAVCAKIWSGSAFGRLLSVAFDRTGSPFNYGSIGFELAMAFAIAAPWIVFLTQSLRVA